VRSLRRGLPALGWLATTALSIALGWVALLPVMRAAAPDSGAAFQLPSTGALPSTTAASPGPSPTPKATVKGKPTAKPVKSPTLEAPATTGIVNGWTQTTGSDGKPVYLRSFRVEGGQAVIRINGGRVQLVTATPAQGWGASSFQNKPEDLAVFFTKPGRGFTIHAIWWENQPFAQVSEP
jgi:hypothetical protein